MLIVTLYAPAVASLGMLIVAARVADPPVDTEIGFAGASVHVAPPQRGRVTRSVDFSCVGIKRSHLQIGGYLLARNASECLRSCDLVIAHVERHGQRMTQRS